MNRIRRVGRAYQVLLTPHQKYNVAFEYLLGSWTDDSIVGFEVRDYGSYREAECEATEHPDINWDQLVDYHKDSYLILKEYLQKFIEKIGITVDFKSRLMNAQQAKHVMFERVLNGQRILAEKRSTTGFRTVYDMNDIISFRIVNPWMKNLNELEIHLMNNNRLNIFRRITKNGITQLVGRTDLGTTYEIILITSVLNNWFEWRQQNKHLSPDIVESGLKNCVKTQKLIDATPSLR